MKRRAIEDRKKSLEPVPTEAHFSLASIPGMGAEFHCKINGYCRTQIFEFPGIDFHPEDEEPPHTIYSSNEVQANVVSSSLANYFENSSFSRHYAISPSLRYKVAETNEKIKSQQKSSDPLFLVIEESNTVTPVEMNKGECRISDEVFIQDGEVKPALIGGREGKKFITAWHTIDGAWPELPNNQPLVNMVLAGVRFVQSVSDPIRKYLDLNGLVTDKGQFVVIQRIEMGSPRLRTDTPMDSTAYRERVSEISKGIGALEQVINAPHVALLINSMYRDDYMDDAHQRLYYLQLWQSLSETGRKYLNYQGNIKKDKVVVAGNKTLEELRDYRDDIAHWWTDSIDENFLADLQRTINELMRSRFTSTSFNGMTQNPSRG